ncbi:hypothetical protein DFQ01_14434 [Paenibacillus cellulosilyticus]|uniref:Uncharacterized protein n=1 Tax=Paenibacillus cellulosilyticus TaxID=375489 RepID=A0A2V2YGM5_9BACL|nr:hypothetical protein [Paenibacillus cellulosilyticus]PWV90258.1 hypothetical protein DFQ01_14434 [Paenibacillus cellulosilyticus]QKS43416.1 hypothetical protein HUB94_02525 [Paenibacillus cellulosilyticus]
MVRRMVYHGSNNGTSPIYRQVPVNASQTIVKGSIVVKTSGKASVAGQAAAAGTVWGVAAEAKTTGGSVTASDVVTIDVNPDSIYEIPFATGGTKTSFTASDIGTVFDLGSNAYTLNPDDTTGGYLEVTGLPTPGSTTRNTVFALIKNRSEN